MTPTRVLLVTTSLGVGGAETALLDLARGLDRERFDVRVVSLMSGGGLVAAFRDASLPVRELGVTPRLGEIRGIRLAPVIAGWRPHVVQGRLILASLWARLGRPLGAKVVCEEMGLALGRPRAVRWIDRATRGSCDVVVANAAAVAARLRDRDGVPAARIRVIHQGVDLPVQPAGARSGPRYDLVTVARLEALKGVLDLPAAMERVVAARPDATLAVVGDGSRADDLRRDIDARGLGGRVTLLGRRSDVPDLLARARVFVLLSHEEGLSSAILEAMASGLPVVATDVGGNPEAVVDGETGTLVPPRDPERAALAVLRYLADPALTEAHGAAGRARVAAEFSVGRMVAEYESLYTELREAAGARS